MDRMKRILTAGTLTGLVLIIALVFGFGRIKANGNEAAITPEIVVNPVVMPDGTAVDLSSPEGQAAYTQQLEATLQVMQAREAAYQQQIDAANQTILQMQDQINTQTQSQNLNARFTGGFSRVGEHEGWEHDDD
ncbi:MAG: hypothetical protein D6835_01310 [Candidatus Thermofonsia bacterium]|nr:MAG: hypothetical protein D6835_01310 [Candidatus Thermofonsia bacterium]